MKKTLRVIGNWRGVRWTRRHPWTIAFTILAIGLALSFRLTYGEINNRQSAVCKGQNAIKHQIVSYLDDLAQGNQTAAAPVPDNLPETVKVFILNARRASRDYSAKAAQAAQTRFRVEACK